MSPLSRRELCQSLPLLALLPTLAVEAQTPAKPAEAPKDCVEPVLDKCAAFPFESLPVHRSPDGGASRHILEGRIPGSELIEMHETTLKPGKMPHPPHRHPEAELMMLKEGTVEFITESAPVHVSAGGAVYCAPNQLHGLRNVGEVDAVYFVMKVGGQPVCQK